MGQKGDLFELIDRAPAHLQTFEGNRWTWVHHERSRRAFEVLANRAGANVSHMMIGSGPIEETLDRHDQVWIEFPNRWRIDGSGQTELSDGVCRWVGGSNHITQVDESAPDLSSTEIGPLINPGDFLFGSLKFDEPSFEEVAGRRCWRVDARPIEGKRHMRPAHLPMRIGGVDHTFWFDAETGIVLRHVGTLEDQPCAIHEFSDVKINHTIEAETFRFTPPQGATVQRSIDGLVRLAEQRGVDLSDVDRDDPAALRRAIQESLHQGVPSSEAMKESRRAKHVPVGPPPADVAEARRQIEYAYANQGERRKDGTTLVNVQSGENMAPLFDQALKRLPKSDPESVTTVVDDVLFLQPTEAVVWFSVEIDGQRFGMVNGREGRAVFVDGRWLVERATLVDLLTFAGVVYPAQGLQ
jgi:hypothetical protein